MPYIHINIQYWCFSFWLTSFCIIGSSSIDLIRTDSNAFFFSSWVIFHSVYTPQLFYPFVCQWTSRLLPCPSYYKQCCSEHWGTCVSFNSGFPQCVCPAVGLLGRQFSSVAQSCLTLSDPMNYTVHGILQARILEWVAHPFSRASSQPTDRTQVSRIAGGFFTVWATRGAQEYWSG